MPELSHISISGFKSIASIEKLALGDINVLIGPNGSGKSNFIAVFDFLRAIRDGRLQEYVGVAGGANRILHFGTKMTVELRIVVSFDDGVNGYEIALKPTASDGITLISEFATYRSEDGRNHRRSFWKTGNEAGISSNFGRGNIPYYVSRHLEKWRIYHFHDTSASSPMRRNCEVNDNRFLRPDGSNLAAFLYLLKEKEPDTYGLIRGIVQQVAPFFDDFQLEPLELGPEMIRLEWRHRNSDTYFDASSLSDGTLRFIALATLFLQPKRFRPSVIIVDEPELGLHPFAIGLLASLVRQASVYSQVILSTQSPILLDYFEPEEVLVADCIDGRTELRRLDSEALESWLEDYSLGELWEKNELGGRPHGNFP